jgi:NAD(P)-dependent dehydrogenase (short-subunit alcohol dehydrogenase family)
VTGANRGLGLEVARRLIGAGARVVLAVRTLANGEQACHAIRGEFPQAAVEARRVDLADLGSVREFADGLMSDGIPLDVLLNNAAVVSPPARLTTADGFELQFGTNVLAPFALTLRLLPLLLAAPAPRVVTVGSLAAWFGRIQFGDLQSERQYRAERAYSQSKLAALILARQLATLAADHGWGLVSNAAHPGHTRTSPVSVSDDRRVAPGLPGASGQRGATGQHGAPGRPALADLIERVCKPAQHVRSGAGPLLYAATSPEAVSGGYYGPRGPFELAGAPAGARWPWRAGDAATAARLWTAAERLTGVSLPGGATPR